VSALCKRLWHVVGQAALLLVLVATVWAIAVLWGIVHGMELPPIVRSR
jgi:hypothetical protein